MAVTNPYLDLLRPIGPQEPGTPAFPNPFGSGAAPVPGGPTGPLGPLNGGGTYGAAPTTTGGGGFQIGQPQTQDNTWQIGVGPDGQLRWFNTGKNGQQNWGGLAPPQNMTPGATSSTSSSTSQTYQDPAYLAYLLAESQRTAANKTTELQIAQGNLDFLQRKQSFEEGIGRSAEARATQAQAFAQQSTIAAMQMQVMQANAAAQQATEQFNATQQMAVQKGNADFETSRQDRLASQATQIGTLGQDAGDRGKYAATVLGSRWGAQPTTGKDLRTDQSLMPLQALLDVNAQTRAQPAPYSYNPQTAPQLGMPSLAGGSGMSALLSGLGITSPPANMREDPNNPNNYIPIAAATGAAQPQLSGSSAADAFANPDTQQSFLGALARAGYLPGVPTSAQQATPAASNISWNNGVGTAPGVAGAWGSDGYKDGGLATAAYISGEAGPEINIPLGRGQALVLNEKQAKALGLDIKKTGKVEKMEDGGVFGARNFLTQASLFARQGTPWEGGGMLPSSTFASSPGFDPVIAQLLSSMNAQENGLPAQSFLRQASLLAPAGMMQSAIRRTA